VKEISDYAIRNCTIAYKCNQRWETLNETDSPKMRYCRECDRHVVACETIKQLKAALGTNSCVAISTDILDFKGGLVGLIVPRNK
jgi:hypothetical protein